ncbi:MAG: type II secretion system F family protein [Elusimicrobia bacterium]|nr:type II secretion system F family protein [Elusimicrobiota bacterium]
MAVLKIIAIVLVIVCITGTIYLVLQKLIDAIYEYRKLKEEKQKRREKQNFLLFMHTNPKALSVRLLKFSFALIGFFLFQALFGKVVFSILFAIACYIIPGKIAKKSFEKRLTLFEDQMIDCFGILTNSLQAGSSLLQGLEVMVRESDPPLSEEFGEVLREVRLGVPVDKALKNLTQRIPSRDLHMAVLAINVTREYGGNLSEILMRIVQVMRERRKIQGKIDSITAQGRVSGWIVTVVPFFLLVVLRFMEPEMFGLMFTTVLGNILLFLAVVMVALGNFFIQKIVTIEI